MPIRTAATLSATAHKPWQRRCRTIRSGALLIAGSIGFALALLMTRLPRRPPPRWRYQG